MPEEKSRLVKIVENSDTNKSSLKTKDYIVKGIISLAMAGCAVALYWCAKEFIEAASHYDGSWRYPGIR